MADTTLSTKRIKRCDRDLGPYSNKEGRFFLTGMFGQNLMYCIMSTALMMFFTDALLVPVATVGIIFAIARIWDAINDPIMGVLVEKTNTKWGKSRPYLKWMPIVIAIVTLLLFLPIKEMGMSTGGMVAYLAVMYFMWSPFYTLCDIPLWSMPSRMIVDEETRTKLISKARIVGTIASAGTALYMPLKTGFGKIDMGMFEHSGLIDYTGFYSDQQGYLFTTLLMLVVGCVMFLFVFPNTRERVKVHGDQNMSFKKSFKLITSNKPFMQIMLSTVLGSTKLIIMTAGMYFCEWVMGNGNMGMYFIIIGIPFMGGNILSLFLTPILGKKFTKKRLYIWTSYLSAIPLIIMFAIGFNYLNVIETNYGIFAMMLIMLGFFGFFSGFSLPLQPIMIADSIDYMEHKNGNRADGLFFSGLTFSAKLTSGIAVLISGGLLGVVAYTEAITSLKETIKLGGSVDFSSAEPEITLMMWILITIVPAIGCILQGVAMHRYKLTDKYMDEIRAENLINRELAEAEAKALEESQALESSESQTEFDAENENNFDTLIHSSDFESTEVDCEINSKEEIFKNSEDLSKDADLDECTTEIYENEETESEDKKDKE